MANDSTGKTILVAVLLCIICSVMVSTAAIKLKPQQEKNKRQFTRTNILKAAGLLEEGKDVDALFKDIEVKYVDIDSGQLNNNIKPGDYNAKEAVRQPEQSKAILDELDLAKIKRRVKTAEVYFVKKNNQLETIIVPIYGKGLWSTMYAFLALQPDGNTVKGLSFYDHGETPGLGGEIENPDWQAGWIGKKIYNDDWKLAINVLKGKVEAGKPNAVHLVDGLSGATLTTNGVRNLVKYWLGPDGFELFLKNTRSQRANNG